MNGLDDDQLDLIISSFANRLLQLGAEFESLAETSSDRKWVLIQVQIWTTLTSVANFEIKTYTKHC